jgi:hypothetical protein
MSNVEVDKLRQELAQSAIDASAFLEEQRAQIKLESNEATELLKSELAEVNRKIEMLHKSSNDVQISLEEAESIKLGSISMSHPQKKLDEIIEARMFDVFELVENHLKKIRHFNRDLIINSLKKSQQWNFNYDFFLENKNTEASWFGLPLMINKSQAWKKDKFMQYLNKNGVETRPIISGNFFNQPVIKLYKFQNLY